MTERDDLLDTSSRTDPVQCAVHGLLCVYFEDAIASHPERTRRILARVAERRASMEAHPQPQAATSRFSLASPPRRLRRWTIGLGGLAVAASLVFAFMFFGKSTQAMADIYADAANAGSAWFRLVGSINFILDADSPEAQVQQRELARLEHEVRAGLTRMPQLPRSDPSINPFCQQWQAYYCLLRDLGRRDDAIREAQAALDFSRSRPVQGYVPIFLDGLANTYVAFGDFPAARQAYMESIKIRRLDISDAWTADPHYGESGYEGHMAWGIAPMYLRLMTLALAEGNLAEVRSQWAAAERAMRQWMTTTRELIQKSRSRSQGGGKARGEDRAGSPSMWEAWLALPPEYRRPKISYTAEEIAVWPERHPPGCSLPAWVRTTVYHEALLLCAEGSYAAAQDALDRAATIADFPDCGEFRLPFLENLEASRLAIIRKDYPAALAAIRTARTSILSPSSDSGPIAPEVNRLPITPLRAAELDQLEGVALLALDENSAEGRQHLEKALNVAEKLAAGLTNKQREALLRQFEAWRRSLKSARLESSLPAV